MRIVFFGTPEFAVQTLKAIHTNGYHVVGVVTAPDKPAGRGRQITSSAVKEYAVQNNLLLLQPERLKSPDFISQLQKLNADVFVVVAFRMLPEVVWKMPPKGTFNLHASLLPQYRGAAPINWAIINGETKTGVTTFFLEHEIDTGKIIFSEEVDILPNDNAGSMHDKLMILGAQLVIKTLQAIESGNIQVKSQFDIVGDSSQLKHAPKIFKETCRINPANKVIDIHNLIRGLSPYPGAFLELINADKGEETAIKIYESKVIDNNSRNINAGALLTDGKTYLTLVCSDGLLSILDLQLTGKKRMEVKEFLRGHPAMGVFRAKIND